MYRQLFFTCAFHGPPSGIQVSFTHSFTEQKIWRQAGFEEMLVSLSKRDQIGMGGHQKRERFLMCIIFMNILMSKIRKRDQSWWRSIGVKITCAKRMALGPVQMLFGLPY